jgi:flagellar biogenesis protein FliO
LQRSSPSAPRIPAGATTQLALMLGAFATGTAVAALAGAELGTACAFGQMAFAIALVTVLMWAP